MKKVFLIVIMLLNFACVKENKSEKEIVQKAITKTTHIKFIEEEIAQNQNLTSKISNENLRDFIQHKNPKLRTNSYKLLIHRELMKPLEVFEEAMTHNNTFSQISGCIISDTDICTEIYFETTHHYPDLKSEIQKMDSLILYKFKEDHFLQYMALKDKKYEEKYNDRIINLPINHNNLEAIFYLVKNNIEVDTLKLKESIDLIVKTGGIGTQPTKELNKVIEKLYGETNTNKSNN